jgi:hypothetical protein
VGIAVIVFILFCKVEIKAFTAVIRTVKSLTCVCSSSTVGGAVVAVVDSIGSAGRH